MRDIFDHHGVLDRDVEGRRFKTRLDSGSLMTLKNRVMDARKAGHKNDRLEAELDAVKLAVKENFLKHNLACPSRACHLTQFRSEDRFCSEGKVLYDLAAVVGVAP